jgi:hypothetical protein
VNLKESNLLCYIISLADLEKAGHFQKIPVFFFKRLKLGNLKKAGHFPKMPGFFD